MSRYPELAHLLGIVGYALMLWCAFGYSWRKRLERHGPGSARGWMRTHIVAGVIGPALVLVHAEGSFRGLAGITMVLTLVIVASGVIGYFLYTAFPAQPPSDDELARIDAELGELISARDANAAPATAFGGERAGTGPTRTERAVLEARIRTLQGLRVAQENNLRTARMRARWRQWLAGWWVLHVPLSMAVLALALVHVIASLYYAPPWR